MFQIAAGGAELDMERAHDHDFVAAGDAGELGVHLRAHVLEFDRIDRIPGLAVAFQRQVEQALDDALFGGGEVTALDARVVAAIAAEQAVDDQEHQVRVIGEERGATQRLHLNHVQIAGHGQVALEVRVLLDLDRADGDVRAATHEVQQHMAHLASETLVDQLQRLHATTHDPVRGTQVVGPSAVAGARGFLLLSLSPVTPASSASTSSCERNAS